MHGTGVSPGIAIGRALVLKEESVVIKDRSTRTLAEEYHRLEQSVADVRGKLEDIKKHAIEELGGKASILDAQILVTQDEDLLAAVRAHINGGMTAEAAMQKGIEFYATILENTEDQYIRERAADVRDVGGRILRNLLGIEAQDLAGLTKDIILVAKDLTPSDTASMNKARVLGFITDLGGRTSHTAIMARSLEIPAIVGARDAVNRIRTGDLLAFDAEEGEITIQPSQEQLRAYQERRSRREEEKRRLQQLDTLPTITADGQKIELGANIGSPQDCEGALRYGAEGIGLYRTEFLYLGRTKLPTEEEQFAAYKTVLEGMGERPVVIRTLDVGGDKEISYLNLAAERNPFLGYRAIRVCLRQEDIFRTQLRALLRASVSGNLRIMFPMISGLEEVRQAKTLLAKVKEELVESGYAVAPNLQVGIMIEVPAAALISDILAKEVDFLSIGTNDLIQYTTAVDRMNERIADLYTPYHPAVLRLIHMVIDNGHKCGRWVGMCGEAAGDPALIPLFLGMGLDEFSMSPISILPTRELIGRLNREALKNKIQEILKSGTAKQVREKLKTLI